MKPVKELFKQFNSSKWEAKLSAADQIAELKSNEGNQFLIDKLKSDNASDRNAAALGMRETRNQIFLEPILNRIKNLGNQENIGTLIYSIQNFDCSSILLELICLHVNGEEEIKMGTSTILTEQTFLISELEKERINKKLRKDGVNLDELGIEYHIE